MTASIGRPSVRRAISRTLWRRFAAFTSIQGSNAEAAATGVAGATASVLCPAGRNAAAPARKSDRRGTPMASRSLPPLLHHLLLPPAAAEGHDAHDRHQRLRDGDREEHAEGAEAEAP